MSFVGAGQPARRHASCARTTSRSTLEPERRDRARRWSSGSSHLGFEVRVELVRDDGERLSVQLTRDEAEQLELARGQIVYVRPTRHTTLHVARDSSRRPRRASVVSSEHSAHRGAQVDPHGGQRPSRPVVFDVVRPDAAHGRDRAFDRADHVGEADLRGRPPSA